MSAMISKMGFIGSLSTRKISITDKAPIRWQIAQWLRSDRIQGLLGKWAAIFCVFIHASNCNASDSLLASCIPRFTHIPLPVVTGLMGSKGEPTSPLVEVQKSIFLVLGCKGQQCALCELGVQGVEPISPPDRNATSKRCAIT